MRKIGNTIYSVPVCSYGALSQGSRELTKQRKIGENSGLNSAPPPFIRAPQPSLTWQHHPTSQDRGNRSGYRSDYNQTLSSRQPSQLYTKDIIQP
jgi:hypothetical protein